MPLATPRGWPSTARSKQNYSRQYSAEQLNKSTARRLEAVLVRHLELELEPRTLRALLNSSSGFVVKQHSEIAPRGRKVNEGLDKKFSDLCELCLCLKVFPACVNLPIYKASRIRIFLPPRREERQVRINIISLSLRPLRPFGYAQDMLCGKYSDSFGCGAAALCLCGEHFFTENQE